MLFFHKVTATFFGAGYLPKAPGTWASIVAVGLYALFFPDQSSLLRQGCFFVIIAAVFALGVWSGGKLEEVYGHDPSYVVIDEVAGAWITLFLLPNTISVLICGLILFRFFDITKWFGADRAQRLPGGWGIMMDDVIAGFWSNIILQLLVRFEVIR